MSLLRESIRKHLLLERRITQMKSQIFINFDLRSDDYDHTGKRQKQRNVSKGDITLLIGKAIDEITTKIVTGELTDNDVFIVRYKNDNLFIPLKLIQVDPYNFTLMTKTVIRKDNEGRPQPTIWVD